MLFSIDIVPSVEHTWRRVGAPAESIETAYVETSLSIWQRVKAAIATTTHYIFSPLSYGNPPPVILCRHLRASLSFAHPFTSPLYTATTNFVLCSLRLGLLTTDLVTAKDTPSFNSQNISAYTNVHVYIHTYI